MKTRRMILPLLLCLFSPLANAESPNPIPRPPEAWNEWARWAEKLHPITDDQGHGPDVGSDEWSGALSRQLGIEDKDSPGYRTKEWRNAIEAKLTGKAVKPDSQRELLSAHQTVARFKGLTKHRCMGLTALCPDRCGHSGRLATFEILKYLDYKKPGEFGDPKQKEFQILIDNSLNKELLGEPERGLLLDLNTGDLVKLRWHHDYVTREGSKFPERVIVDLEPITKEQADSLLSP